VATAAPASSTRRARFQPVKGSTAFDVILNGHQPVGPRAQLGHMGEAFGHGW
jgi:hypothetical protein